MNNSFSTAKTGQRSLKVVLAYVILSIAATLTSAGFEASESSEKSLLLTFQRLRTEQGLPNNVVYCAVQDKLGFMWFGTLNGLARYDGYGTTVYRHYPEDSNSLAANSVWNLSVDGTGELWVTSLSRGVTRFNPKLERFTRYRHDPESSNSISSDTVYATIEDPKGRIWFATESGLDMLDATRKMFTHFQHDPAKPDSLPSPSVTSLLIDASDDLWVGTLTGGFCRLDLDTLTFDYFSRDAKTSSLEALNTVWGFCQDSQGALWIGGGGGVGRLDPRSERLEVRYVDERQGDAGEVITTDSEVFPGELWACGSLGIDVLSMKTGKMRTITADASRLDRLSSFRVWSIYRSENDLIWLSTSNGVDYFSTKGSPFFHLFRIAGSDDALHGNSVQALCEDGRGGVWLGTELGLDVYNPADGGISHIPLSWFEDGRIENTSVTGVVSDSRGDIWIASVNGVIRYNPLTKESSLYSMVSPEPRKLDRNLVAGLAVSGDGVVWIATKGGGLYEVLKNGGLKRRKPTNVFGQSFGWINSITVDGEGRIWLAMQEGLAIYNPKSDETVYNNKLNPDERIVGEQVFDVFEDQAGRFFAGTDMGLNQLDRHGRAIRFLSEKDGLPSNIVYSIQEDAAGSLWLGTDSGLARYDQETGLINVYAAGSGKRKLQYSPAAAIRGPDGRLYFGSSNGVVYFSPADVAPSDQPLEVVLTDFRIDDVSVSVGPASPLKESISHADTVTLDFWESHFAISFSALDYLSPQTIQYAYRLDGFDRKWIHTGANHRIAAYTGLHPGRYRFRVKAANPGGVWNPRERVLEIVIRPPWWMTWWFKLSVVVAVAASLATFYAWRVWRLKARGRLLEREVKTRTAELRTEKERVEAALAAEREAIQQNLNFIDMISHEYRTPLSVISSSLELIERKLPKNKGIPDLADQVTAMREATKRLRDVFEASLNEKRVDDSGIKLKRTNVNLRDIVKTVVGFIKHAYPDHEIVVNDALTDAALEGDQELLTTAIGNVLDNACKYSNAESSVTLTLSAEVGAVVVSIEDKGRGIAEEDVDRVFEKFFRSGDTGERVGAGVGLFLVKKILTMHDGRVTVTSKHRKGTTVVMTIPKNSEADTT